MPVILANGIRQYFKLEGDAAQPVLVLAHPVGFDHSLWDALVPLLTPRFHVLRHDLRGHGGTQVTEGDTSVELLAADLMGLARALGIESFALFGTSLGGLVGLWLAAHGTTALTRLVVSNLSAKLPLPPEEWNKRIALARSSGLEGFVQGMQDRMFSQGYRQGSPPLFHTLTAAFRHTDPAGYASGLAALRDADLRGMLPDIAVPTLVIAGESDMAVPAAHTSFIADSIKGARLVTVPGGHLSPVEASAQVSRHIIDFLTA